MANWTNYQISLAFMMLITGSINTLSAKWADSTESKGKLFDHPFVQAVGMFIGEFSCLLVFYIIRCRRRREVEIPSQPFNPLIFLPASLMDMCGTSTMYVGLNLTYASSFQMLRGAVMIFTALLSVAFLGRRIRAFMWLGMVLVVIGLALVGISDIVFHRADDGKDVNSIITGDLLIIVAQVIAACQMVYEEKVVTKYNVPPLQAVGWEGFFGFFVLGLLLIPFYWIPGQIPFTSSDDRLEDTPEALRQMAQNWQIILATIGNVVSIAFFNFSGISVTKEMSATTRMVIDSCRTVIIWIVSLSVGWQPFSWQSFLVQLAGFVLLILGMCVYNDLICGPYLRRTRCCGHEDEEPLLPAINDADYGINTNSLGEDTPVLQAASDNYGSVLS